MRTAIETISTDGSGYWSTIAKDVAITGLILDAFDYGEDREEDDEDFGELRVYFDVDTWDVSEDGLIYTDKAFLKGLQDYLRRAGYAAEDVGYSEQGMQGDNYVSLDVGAAFIKSWNR